MTVPQGGPRNGPTGIGNPGEPEPWSAGGPPPRGADWKRPEQVAKVPTTTKTFFVKTKTNQ